MNFGAPYNLFPEDQLKVHFHPEHWDDLMKSGLEEDVIKTAGVYSLAPRFIEHFFKGTTPAEIETALCFPYQGKKFARIKLFPSLGKWKYSQPPGTSARLYMPFPVADDLLYVVEGEKKTLAAYQHGLNVVGIGGVWNWVSKGSPIDDLAFIEWDNRDVIIIPDSDVFERPDLLRAIYALGRELRNQGGSVRVARIPHSSNKVGLDDYLQAGGDVEELETFGLDQRVFGSSRFWYGRWKLKAATQTA